jgi:hypothetical protein
MQGKYWVLLVVFHNLLYSRLRLFILQGIVYLLFLLNKVCRALLHEAKVELLLTYAINTNGCHFMQIYPIDRIVLW